MEILEYFDQRLSTLKAELSLGSVTLYQRDFSESLLPVASTDPEPPANRDRSGEVPIVFGESPLGLLYVTGGRPENSAHLQGFAQQLACLWQLPNVKAAIELDKKIEALTKKFPVFQWCGVYRVVGGTLYVTAFRGEATPHAIIPKGQGICGAAVTQNQTLNIPDVSADPRYLSCDFRAKSELVVPIRNSAGEAIAEIDIDSHFADAFQPRLVAAVEEAARDVTPLVLELV